MKRLFAAILCLCLLAGWGMSLLVRRLYRWIRR